MTPDVPPIIHEIEAALAPHKIYLVGGAVRHYLQNKPWPHDLDLATSAKPEETLKALQNLHLPTDTAGKYFGVIKTKTPNHTLEIATLRQESYKNGSHYPKVTFIDSLEQDSHRRDFTINAIYLETNGQLHDFHNGQQDLKNHIVRFIGDKETRLKEDPTRQQRYERFQQEFGKK